MAHYFFEWQHPSSRVKLASKGSDQYNNFNIAILWILNLIAELNSVGMQFT